MNKRSKLALLIALLLITGSIVYLKITSRTKIFEKQIVHSNSQLRDNDEKSIALAKKLSNHIADHEQRVWKELANISISQERCKNEHAKTYDLYIRETDKAFNKPEGPVAKHTEKLIHGIMHEFGINPAEITLVSSSSIMGTANACDKLMLINEKNFSMFSEQAQKFIIAHEVQHILNKDHSICATIRNLLPREQREELILPRMHPLMQYYRFKEERADLGVAMKSKEWAERYLAYTNEIMNVYGNSNYPTHPQSSDRLQFAQNIMQEINTQTI